MAVSPEDLGDIKESWSHRRREFVVPAAVTNAATAFFIAAEQDRATVILEEGLVAGQNLSAPQMLAWINGSFPSRVIILAASKKLARPEDARQSFLVDLMEARRAFVQEALPFWRIPLAALWNREQADPGPVMGFDISPSPALLDMLGGYGGPILLHGPTGTGKTRTGRLIHQLTRPTKPFHVENCAAIEENRRDAFFRGVKDRAFTGVEGSESIFKEHDGGTVLLDDFQDLSLNHQGTLLDLLDPFTTVVQGKKLQEAKEVWTADVQVILAVNKPPTELLAQRELRPDIYYRVRRRLPFPPLAAKLAALPLEEERDTLRLLMLEMQERHFRIPPAARVSPMRFLRLFDLHEQDGSVTRSRPFRTSTEIPDILLKYEWPGNFRQLESLAVTLMEKRDGTLGLWSDPTVRAAFAEIAPESSAPLGQEGPALPESTREYSAELCIAQAYALAARTGSLSSGAAAMGLDRRTFEKHLAILSGARAVGPVPRRVRSRLRYLLELLSAAERRDLVERARELVSSRSARR